MCSTVTGSLDTVVRASSRVGSTRTARAPDWLRDTSTPRPACVVRRHIYQSGACTRQVSDQLGVGVGAVRRDAITRIRIETSERKAVLPGKLAAECRRTPSTVPPVAAADTTSRSSEICFVARHFLISTIDNLQSRPGCCVDWVGFTDPIRVCSVSLIDGLSRTIDDMSSFGPSLRKIPMSSKDVIVKTPVRLPESGVPVAVDFDHTALLARYDAERGARMARPAGGSRGAGAHDDDALRSLDRYTLPGGPSSA